MMLWNGHDVVRESRFCVKGNRVGCGGGRGGVVVQAAAGQGGAAGVGVAEPDFSRRVGEVARNDNLFGKRTELWRWMCDVT